MNENNESRKGIFFGIIGVLTLIVAIIGATLAYFTATSGSNTNRISVQSAQLIVNYNESRYITAGDLIPASTSVVKIAGNRTENETCIDDAGNEVCAEYSFNIENQGAVAQNVIITITSGLNEFTNLSYIVYNVTEDENNPILEAVTLPETAESKNLISSNLNDAVSIGANEIVEFKVLIYLLETASNQDEEQDSSFAGTVNVRIAGTNASGEITGLIN